MTDLPRKKAPDERTPPKELSMSTSKKTKSLPEDAIAPKSAALPHRPRTDMLVTRTRDVRDAEEINPRSQPPSSQSSWLARERVTDTQLLTLKQAADRLAISLPTIRAWVWQRKIEIVKIGRCVRIREQVISELIFKSTIPPRAKV